VARDQSLETTTHPFVVWVSKLQLRVRERRRQLVALDKVDDSVLDEFRQLDVDVEVTRGKL
jgi:hypothetical protein